MIEENTVQFRRTTFALSVAAFFIFANLHFPQPILPVLASEFHVSDVVVSLIISVPLFVLAIAFFVYGPLSDTIGRKKIMNTAMVFACIISLGLVVVPSFEGLLVLRTLQAVALAGVPTIALAYISEEYAKKAMTVAIGVYISANSFGGMVGRFMSGVVTDVASWRMAFLVMGLISVVSVILVLILLPKSKQFEPQSFDFKSVISHYKHHLLDKQLQPAFIVGGLHFLLFIGFYSYVAFLLLGEPFSLSTTVIGFIFITYMAGTVSSTLAGKLSKKHSQVFCLKIGIVIMAIGVSFTLISHLFMIVLGLLLLSFGFFFAHSCSSAWVSKYSTVAKASASGLYLTSYYVGGGLGGIYLGWFWMRAGWLGVVLGSMIVLMITTIITIHMKHLEVNDHVESPSITAN
ncbi:MFS transporter [Alkalihalophilus lindianensis]|uniref:MFS transporter n=2 Tax=Bacillaceae TaxID=186817 RepID=A0ABU3XBH0_9BACI|nr:MFS transporter [Alkalihalophilus lindianensis]MDV2685237.1 MFS transporter [Alkalihalophilus lindianensis]